MEPTDIVLLIAFFLIYAIFLLYDLFQREGEASYGNWAYFIAILPANYIWVITVNDGNLSFNYAGAMLILCLLWVALVIRDIYLKIA